MPATRIKYGSEPPTTRFVTFLQRLESSIQSVSMDPILFGEPLTFSHPPHGLLVDDNGKVRWSGSRFAHDMDKVLVDFYGAPQTAGATRGNNYGVKSVVPITTSNVPMSMECSDGIWQMPSKAHSRRAKRTTHRWPFIECSSGGSFQQLPQRTDYSCWYSLLAHIIRVCSIVLLSLQYIEIRIHQHSFRHNVVQMLRPSFHNMLRFCLLAKSLQTHLVPLHDTEFRGVERDR